MTPKHPAAAKTSCSETKRKRKMMNEKERDRVKDTCKK